MKKFIYITLFLVAFGLVAGFVYGQFIDKPSYVSSARLIVKSPKTANQAKDFTSIALSDSVLGAAQSTIDTSADLATLRQYVTVVNPTGTNVIELTVTTASPELSKSLADAVIAGTKEQVIAVYEEDNISVLDASTDAKLSSAPKPLLTAALGAAAGIGAGLAIAFVFYEHKRTQEEEAASAKSTESAPSIVAASPKAAAPQISRAPKAGSVAKKPRQINRIAAKKVAPARTTKGDEELKDLLDNLDM